MLLLKKAGIKKQWVNRPGGARAHDTVAWSEEHHTVAGSRAVFAAVPVVEPVGREGGCQGVCFLAVWKHRHKPWEWKEMEKDKQGQHVSVSVNRCDIGEFICQDDSLHWIKNSQSTESVKVKRKRTNSQQASTWPFRSGSLDVQSQTGVCMWKTYTTGVKCTLSGSSGWFR